MRKQANKKNRMPLLKRVLGIMLREYKVQFGLVVVLILGAALDTLRGTPVSYTHLTLPTTSQV